MRTNPIITAIASCFAALACSCAPESLPQAELPIMAWYSIMPCNATLDHYQDLKDCGFNVTFSSNSNIDEMLKELELCGKVGIKAMANCPELYTATDSAIALMKDDPSLYGYFLRDEPFPKDFPDLAEWAERIRACDSTHTLYLNLFPSYVGTEALGCTYQEYVHRFIEEVKLPMVSFDYYPVTVDGIRQSWYEDLNTISEESAAAGLPFWAFTLSTAHICYPLATMASLRLQLYTDLAFGAQGVQYFTYADPVNDHSFDFHAAPTDGNGEKTDTYPLVQAMNKELQARAGVFVGAKVVSVALAGKEVPEGVDSLTTMPSHVKSLDLGEDGAVVSILENGKYLYLMIVSRTLERPTDIEVEFDEKAYLVNREGNLAKAEDNKAALTLEEGDAAIFRFRK